MQKLMDLGCIEPSNSPYASPLVLVRKKEGGLRVCVDYRNVNKDTVPNRFPMPRIDELVDTVGRTRPRLFTCLDLMRGYHQDKICLMIQSTKRPLHVTWDCINTGECRLG